MSVFDYLSISINLNTSFFFDVNVKQPLNTEVFSFKIKEDSKLINYQAVFTSEDKIDLRMVYNDINKHFKKIGQFTVEKLDLIYKSLIKNNYKMKKEHSLFSQEERKNFLLNILNYLIKENFNLKLDISEIKVIIDFLYKTKSSSLFYIKSDEDVEYPSEALLLIFSNNIRYMMFEKNTDILEHNLFHDKLILSKFQRVIKNQRYDKNIIKQKFVSNHKNIELDILIHDFIVDSNDHFLELFNFKRKISYFYDTNLKGLL